MTLNTYQYWCNIAYKVCFPILDNLSKNDLKNVFCDNRNTSHLEAFCRVLLGLAPWIEKGQDEKAIALRQLTLLSIDSIFNPFSNDYIDFSTSEQTLVESALLCQAFIRCYNSIWCSLSTNVQNNVINNIKKTRKFIAHDNNWVLFPSMIEAFFLKINQDVDYKRLWYGIEYYKKWYKGDGFYGDGEELHMDYYNSFIIHPILYDTLQIICSSHLSNNEIKYLFYLHEQRMKRFAVLQERMIAPDGTFPPLGRSLTYRCGVFHTLSTCVLYDKLPNNLKPSQVRVALSRVIKATLEHTHTFENNWLTIGLYGQQPNLAEPYINHGSLYFCTTIFLPLGLPKTSAFWSDKDEPTTWELLINGHNIERDKPYKEVIRKIGKCL